MTDEDLNNELKDRAIDHQRIFEGYHINQNHWIAIKPDGSVDTETVYQLPDQSYVISQQKYMKQVRIRRGSYYAIANCSE